MLKVIKESEIQEFDDLFGICWSDALDVLEEIRNVGKCLDVYLYLQEMFPNGTDETTLNDFIRYELPDIMGLYE